MVLPLINMFTAQQPVHTIFTSHEMVMINGCVGYEPSHPRCISSVEGLLRLTVEFYGLNIVESYVNDWLKNDATISLWRKSMPSVVPHELAKYQSGNFNPYIVDSEIKTIGAVLTPGQVLFHGGNLPEGILPRQLSTTFCPNVAISEALHKGKADAIGQVNIYVITVNASNTCVYVYNQSKGKLSHEKEVLFASGAFLDIEAPKQVGSFADGKPCFMIPATIS